MSKKEFDPEDPMELVGVELTSQSEAELRDMALCFAEEFAREGWDEKQLLAMFKNPFYKGPYLAWQQKGDEFILEVIKEAFAMWRPVRHPATEKADPSFPPEADQPPAGGGKGDHA